MTTSTILTLLSGLALLLVFALVGWIVHRRARGGPSRRERGDRRA